MSTFWEDIFGKGGLLIAVIFTGMGVLFGVIWGKRQVHRVFLLSKKGPVGKAGWFAPKELRKEIDQRFDLIAGMRLEPKLLSDECDQDLTYTTFVDDRDDSSYKYRRKAFDLMGDLDELLCRVNILLVRKHNQSVRDHLKLLQGPPYSPFENLSDLCERTTCKYEHARYGSKEFGEEDFIEYSNYIEQLVDRVHQKFLVPGSLLVNPEHHQHIQTSELNDDFDGESFAEPSISIEGATKFGLRPSCDSKAALAIG